MSIKVFIEEIAAKRKLLGELMRHKLPIKVGAMAKAEYLETTLPIRRISAMKESPHRPRHVASNRNIDPNKR